MILGLQYVRGIAAMMVVYHHTGFQVLKATGHLALPLWHIGAAGVDLFFVTSGFIMWVTTQDTHVTAAEFCYRRIARIAPLYWLATLFLLGVSLLAPHLLATIKFDPWHAVESLFFLPVGHPILTGEALPFIIQGWTLNYEMFFYALFALVLLLAPEFRFATLIGALAALAVVGLLVQFENLQAKFYTSTIVLEFAFGVAIGALHTRARSEIPPFWAAALGALGVVALLLVGMNGYGPSGFDPMRALIWGVPAAAMVFGVVMLDRAGHMGRSQSLLRLGDSSYSLYLTHIFTLPLTVIAWRAAGLGFTGLWFVAYTVLGMAASALVGWLTYAAVERPITRMLRDLRFSPGLPRVHHRATTVVPIDGGAPHRCRPNRLNVSRMLRGRGPSHRFRRGSGPAA